MEEAIKMHLLLLRLPQPGSNWFSLGKVNKSSKYIVYSAETIIGIRIFYFSFV